MGENTKKKLKGYGGERGCECEDKTGDQDTGGDKLDTMNEEMEKMDGLQRILVNWTKWSDRKEKDNTDTVDVTLGKSMGGFDHTTCLLDVPC